MNDINGFQFDAVNFKYYNPVSNGTSATLQWQVWNKPRNCIFVFMVLIGGGGGGGGGCGKTAAGAAGGGGGSGGSAATSIYLIPSIFVPDTLFINVGAGGNGGAGGVSGAGTAGGTVVAAGLTRVALRPANTQPYNLYGISGAAAAGGGGGGTSAAVGGAGSGGTLATNLLAGLGNLGFYQFRSGQIGVAGGAVAGANGTNVTAGSSVCILPGTSGAGSTAAAFVGGLYSAIANTFLTPAVTTVGAGNGSMFTASSGFRKNPYYYFFGGHGGGSSNTLGTPGGAGGNGVVPGAGGGGGGAGTTQGGRGGDGGPGLCVIGTW